VKRFYAEVSVADGTILLDGRSVKTPARAPLALPFPKLAEAIADEWRVQGDEIDPRAMPMTGLANAAIDRVATDPAAFAHPLAAYAETDLLCYRAESPPELIAEEAAAWDPVLDWARGRYDVHFTVTAGVVHAAQPQATVIRLAEALRALPPFPLAAMSPLVTIGGSLVAALAVAEDAVDAGAAFELTHLDELWQARMWGEDALAAAAREARRHDFLDAARFLKLSR
jgi:chaperone required for assembly of F1-ATPase